MSAIAPEQPSDTTPAKPAAHILVFGNEKGGSGKSTSAMHVAIALLRMGYKVASIDLDARQGTFSQYMRNRFEFVKQSKKTIPSPNHMAIEKSQANTVALANAQDQTFLEMALTELSTQADFIIIDTPGSDSFLSRLAHSYADTLITPINDSFIDLDLLATLDSKTFDIKKISVYAQMVQEQRERKKQRDGGTINWIVMRNRLSHINAKNKKLIGLLLQRIGLELDFKVAPGFGERVVFRELFLKGLTLLDVKDSPENPLTLSQVTGRQEVRQLIAAIAPETLKGHATPLEKKTA